MQTIWKFPLQITNNQNLIVPFGTKFLTAQVQDDELQLWGIVNPEGSYQSRTIGVFGTGETLPEGVKLEYISTFQLEGGTFVFHVFEIISES